MSSLLGPQGSSDSGGLDLLTVNRDADLLDLLAKRAPVPTGDHVLALLAALAADVDEGLDAMLVAREDDALAAAAAAAAATVVPDLPPVRRGHGLRATTIAVVVGATLSLGGVAAAVTGDPLAPVKGIATAVGFHANDKHDSKMAALTAGKNAKRQIHGGNLAGARASIDAMRAELTRTDLSKGDRRAIEARLAALEGQLARATAVAAGQGEGQQSGKAGSSGKKPTSKPAQGGTSTGGKPSTKPKATHTAEPPATGGGSGADSGRSTGSGATTGPSENRSGGARASRPSPSSVDDPEDAPAPKVTAEPGGSAGSGDTPATGGGKGKASGKASGKA